jgi:hypothetical protein
VRRRAAPPSRWSLRAPPIGSGRAPPGRRRDRRRSGPGRWPRRFGRRTAAASPHRASRGRAAPAPRSAPPAGSARRSASGSAVFRRAWRGCGHRSRRGHRPAARGDGTAANAPLRCSRQNWDHWNHTTRPTIRWPAARRYSARRRVSGSVTRTYPPAASAIAITTALVIQTNEARPPGIGPRVESHRECRGCRCRGFRPPRSRRVRHRRGTRTGCRIHAEVSSTCRQSRNCRRPEHHRNGSVLFPRTGERGLR